MKVLHLAGGGDVGGAKSHILYLVNELRKYIDVKIISFRDGPFVSEGRALGIDIDVVHTGSIFKDISIVVDTIRKGKYDIVHSHGSKANMVSVFARMRTKFISLTTVHSDYRLDYLHSLPKRLTFGTINALALRLINNYVAVSSNFKKMLIKRHFESFKIFTVYNGVDFNTKFKPMTRAELAKKYNININEDDIVAGILARLHPVKGLDTLIKAANEVVKKNKSVKFLICGEGDERKALEHQIANLGLTDNVFLLGHVDEPLRVLSNFDINLLTSLSESFPYAILEGTILKKPTISSNVGGISDLIEDGVNGFLFQPGDYLALAERLNKLISDKALRQTMGEKIYEKAKANFSLESMCKTQLGIYEKIIKNSQKAKGYDIILSGYYGYKNSGDDAILMAIINNLRLFKPDIRLLVLSACPSETRARYGVDSFNRYNLIKMIIKMKSSKLFIYGGGNLLQDDTSTRSLMYYLGTTWLAKMTGLKMMFYASGIGPINKKFNRSITRKIINNVDVITLREKYSLNELKSLNINKPEIHITADPVLTLDPELDERIYTVMSNEGIDSNNRFVGFSIREWDNRERYIELFAKTADYVYEKYNLLPVFIPMQYPDDIKIIQDVAKLMKTKAYIIKNEYSVTDIFGIISKMEMLIGMRLHSLIYAAILEVPTVGIIYEPKVEAFLQAIQLSESSTGDISELTLERICHTFDHVWENRNSIKKHLKSVTPALKEKAYESAHIALNLLEK